MNLPGHRIRRSSRRMDPVWVCPKDPGSPPEMAPAARGVAGHYASAKTMGVLSPWAVHRDRPHHRRWTTVGRPPQVDTKE